jgi:hypothetical protein
MRLADGRKLIVARRGGGHGHVYFLRLEELKTNPRRDSTLTRNLLIGG